MKYAIFIIGERKSGKSTIIRSLTGCGRRKKREVWRVMSLSGQRLKAFIVHSSPQEMSVTKYPPNNFLQAFENEFGINRNDYDILISALELNVRDPQYSYKEYVSQTRNQGFDVRIAVINVWWNGTSEDPTKITDSQNFAQQNKIPITLVNASEDPNVAANKLRSTLYP